MGNREAFEPFQQNAVYAETAARCGAHIRWLDCGDSQALAVERGRLRLISRVVLQGDDRERRQAVRTLARWPGLTVVTPEAAVSGWGLVPLVTPMHHAVWKIDRDLRAGLADNWRNQLKVADRSGLLVQVGEADTLEKLIAAEALQRRERRYQTLSAQFLRAVSPDALRLWQWRDGERFGAGMAFVRHGTSATYAMAWGTAMARKAGVHKLMLTRAAEALLEEGVRWLDLGSVDTEASPGLARFKLGTGAILRKLGATCLVLPWPARRGRVAKTGGD